MTHPELVQIAAKWLAKTCPVVVTEIVTTAQETPDALGWRGWGTTLIECKASRSDFLADARKMFRQHPSRGLGLHRYFLSAPDVISVDDLPADWGLLHVVGQRVKAVKKSSSFEHNMRAENAILLSCLRRIGQTCPAGISVRCYQIKTGRTATLGFAPDSLDFELSPATPMEGMAATALEGTALQFAPE